MPAFWQSLLLSSHHIKSKNLYPASKDRPSLPLNTYLILPSCWSSHRSIEGSLTWSSLSICVCCSPSVGTFPCCWHKTWTQATFPPKRLSCLLHLIDYLFLWTLTCSYRQWGDLIQQCFVLFFFSLCYFRKLDCRLTIRWLCLWGQRFERSVPRPQHDDPMRTLEMQLTFSRLTPLHPSDLRFNLTSKGQLPHWI